MPLGTYDPWQISETMFPQDKPISEQFLFLLNYAALAPSSHNSQPWLFRLRDEALELFADRTRALPVIDPMDRELIISCGAALFHLRTALRHFGYCEAVATFPESNLPDLVAKIRVAGPHEPSIQEQALFRAIPLRRTYRMSFEPRPVPEEILTHLQAVAADEGACLNLVEGKYSRAAMADLIEEADQLQWANKHFRRELAAWVHPNRSFSHDGMPGYALGMPDLLSYLGPIAVRTFDLGKGQAARDRQSAIEAPVMALLTTVSDEPPAWLAAGQAVDRVLLLARSEGVYASFLNQPIEVPDLRPSLSKIAGTQEVPQLLLRMGYGKELRPTPRRAVQQFLLD